MWSASRDGSRAVCDVHEIAYVVLAAGRSQRMGFAKVTAPLAGRSPLERLRDTLADRAVTIVTNASLVDACSAAMPSAQVLVNERPQDGMTSSLLVAHRAIAPGRTIGVLLADKPLVRETTLERCEDAFAQEPACDVCFPSVNGEPGHPVYFGARARALLDDAAAGDTLRAVRDDPSLARRTVPCDDAGALLDLDTPEAWQTAERDLRSHA